MFGGRARNLWAASRSGMATSVERPQKQLSVGELLTPNFGVMVTVLSAPAYIGYHAAQVGLRNDAATSALSAKLEVRLAGLEKLLDEKVKAINEKVGGI